MQTTKYRCRALRARGCSVREIALKLGLSRSTVHWHVHDIRITEVQRTRLYKRWCQRMAEVNGLRRGRAIKKVHFLRPQWSARLVRLVSHFAFDGRVDRYGCFYYSRSIEQIEHVRALIEQLLGVTPHVKKRSGDMWMVCYRNVELAVWLMVREHELERKILKRREWQRQWLKALFDDEGHIHISGGRRRVRASQKDSAVLYLASRLLKEIGIQSRIDHRAQAVEITGRANLTAFRDQLGFSPGIRLNGRRKNGLWREDVEKRELLNLALASYRKTALSQLGR